MPLPTLATPPLIVPAVANLLPSPFVEQRAGIGDHAAKRQCSPVVDRNGAGNGGAAAISSVSLNASIVALLPEVFSTPPKMTASLSWTSAPLPRASITAAAVLRCRQSLGPIVLKLLTLSWMSKPPLDVPVSMIGDDDALALIVPLFFSVSNNSIGAVRNVVNHDQMKNTANRCDTRLRYGRRGRFWAGAKVSLLALPGSVWRSFSGSSKAKAW
jgi:hypothetical protein